MLKTMPTKEETFTYLDRSGWIDVSIPLREGMVRWPADPPFHLMRVHATERGDRTNLSAVTMSTHTGTHIDAPLHFFGKGASLDELPFSTVIGTAKVIEIKDPRRITADELKQHSVACGDRILLKTANSSRCYATDRFVEDYVHLSWDAAKSLVSAAVQMVGVDYLSVGSYPDDVDGVHGTLLQSDVWILEGLNLSKVAGGLYDLICLPLGIAGADGAPARVLLRARE